MKLVIRIDMDNEAFHPAWEQEAAVILQNVCSRLLDGADSGKLSDTNGNTVGRFAVVGDPPKDHTKAKEFAKFLDGLLNS